MLRVWIEKKGGNRGDLEQKIAKLITQKPIVSRKTYFKERIVNWDE